jgi:hypothetical protein
MKMNSLTRISIGVCLALVGSIAVIWVLSRTLGTTQEPLFAGRPAAFWQAQLNSSAPGASNEAFTVVNTQVIPQLTNTMFHDFNDSSIRVYLVRALNELPGVEIYFSPADARRASAAETIGLFGPAAKSAVPALIQALKDSDNRLMEAVIKALGNIHTDPDVIIPLLMTYLDKDDLNDEAATELANYGSLAKVAVPKIIPLLHAADDDARVAARDALLKIDPEAAAKAGVGKK